MEDDKHISEISDVVNDSDSFGFMQWAGNKIANVADHPAGKYLGLAALAGYAVWKMFSPDYDKGFSAKPEIELVGKAYAAEAAVIPEGKNIIDMYDWDGVWNKESKKKGVRGPGRGEWSASLNINELRKDLQYNPHLFKGYDNLKRFSEALKNESLFNGDVSIRDDEISMIRMTQNKVYCIIRTQDPSFSYSKTWSKKLGKNVNYGSVWVNITPAEKNLISRYISE